MLTGIKGKIAAGLLVGTTWMASHTSCDTGGAYGPVGYFTGGYNDYSGYVAVDPYYVEDPYYGGGYYYEDPCVYGCGAYGWW